MAQLYLPLAHTEADLVLAGLVAERVDSAELYVVWTPAQGRAVPEVMAELREERLRGTGMLRLLLEAARALWGALLGRRSQRLAPPPAVERPAQPKPAT